MAFAGDTQEGNWDEIVSFPEWREELRRAPALSPTEKQAQEKAILGLLRACKASGRPLSAGFIRWYLDRGSQSAAERKARRGAADGVWF